MSQLRWGVIGVGRAGAARVRAIQDDPRADLVGGFGGAPSSVGIQSFDTADALLDAVDAVVVSTPDLCHPDDVRRAISADCHVVCEFPLAPTRQVASALFERAQRAQRVLHVGHIELLSGAAGWLRSRCAGRRILGGELSFSGGSRSGIASVAHANIARLHRLVDAVGLPSRVVQCSTAAGSLHATCLVSGAEIVLRFDLKDGARRRTEMRLELEDGLVEQIDRAVFDAGEAVELPAAPGLFASDQRVATQRILDGQPPYVSQRRLLDVLGLADQLVAAGETS